jgi:hypothetical protein
MSFTTLSHLGAKKKSLRRNQNMKGISYRTKIMLLSVLAALFLMPTGWGGGVSSIATLGPGPVLAQGGQQPTNQPGDNIFKQFAVCGGERDTFTFQAKADDVVVIRAIECVDLNILCGCCARYGLENCVSLRDSAGIEIARNCADDTRITKRLPSGGIYSIVFFDADGAGGGRYNLFLQLVNDPGRAENLGSIRTRVGTINNCGQVDTYTFNARAGDRVKIDMVKGAVGNVVPRVELYDDSGRAIAIPAGGSIDQTVATSGRFTLLAYSNDTGTGTYTITSLLPTTLNVPLVFTGQASEGVRQTTFVLANTSNREARGELEFFEPDGITPLEVIIVGRRDFFFRLSIPAGGVQILKAEGTGPLAQGVAKITIDAPIGANVILRSENQMGQVVFETAYGTPTSTKGVTVPVDSVGPATDTGLVLFNPPPFPGDQPQTATITLKLVNRRGEQVGDPVVLPANAGALATGPNGEVIHFMTILFPMAPGIDEFQGTIVISSSVPVSVLTVQKRGERLTFVPGF